MSPEVGDNREILAYFLSICEPFSFQLVAPRQTYLRKAVLLSQLLVFVKRLSLKIDFQTSFAKPNNL
jgi:hypothetical protein